MKKISYGKKKEEIKNLAEFFFGCNGLKEFC